MTVSSTSSRNVLAGNGSTTQFPAGFRVDQPGDLVVTDGQYRIEAGSVVEVLDGAPASPG